MGGYFLGNRQTHSGGKPIMRKIMTKLLFPSGGGCEILSRLRQLALFECKKTREKSTIRQMNGLLQMSQGGILIAAGERLASSGQGFLVGRWRKFFKEARRQAIPLP